MQLKKYIMKSQHQTAVNCIENSQLQKWFNVPHVVVQSALRMGHIEPPLQDIFKFEL